MQRPASHLQSLHLLRALLREASYLPDANARLYFSRYIVNRFRAYQPRVNANNTTPSQAVDKYLHRSFRRRNDAIIAARTRDMQRRAHQGLNYLRRAVQGERPCLKKILLFAYGRVGRRRYALLEDLLRPDPEHDLEPYGSAPLQKLYHSNDRYLAFFDAPKTKGPDHLIDISTRYSRLKAVVKSQSQKGVALNSAIRSFQLKTPINNIWQRPMPIKRARNNVRRWYAKTMTRLLPPLPSDEWDSLQAMADGTKWISFVKRRTPAVELDPVPESDAAQFKQLVDAALALNKPSKADSLPAIHRPDAFNTRSMRRLYASILVYCSKLEWNEERSNWNVVWGIGLSSINRRIYSAPVDDVLFAGVDQQGKTIREPSPGRLGSEKKPKRKHVIIPFFVDYLPPTHPLRVEADVFRSQQRDATHARELRSVRSTVGGEPS